MDTDTRPEQTESKAKLDIRERGRAPGGGAAFLDRRLFVQLHVFSGRASRQETVRRLESIHLNGILYESVTDPYDIGVLSFSEDPEYFAATVRELFAEEPFAALDYCREYQMFGRTYSRGYEPDLEEALVRRPISRLLDPASKWGVWYPLRRSGAFERLEADERRKVLAEHGEIGHSFGREGYAHDIRLASHGLNRDDNDFVIGLLGPELYPLSALVQRMRSTRQTSQFLTRLGPFFVGRTVWQRAA